MFARDNPTHGSARFERPVARCGERPVACVRRVSYALFTRLTRTRTHRATATEPQPRPQPQSRQRAHARVVVVRSPNRIDPNRIDARRPRPSRAARERCDAMQSAMSLDFTGPPSVLRRRRLRSINQTINQTINQSINQSIISRRRRRRVAKSARDRWRVEDIFIQAHPRARSRLVVRGRDSSLVVAIGRSRSRSRSSGRSLARGRARKHPRGGGTGAISRPIATWTTTRRRPPSRDGFGLSFPDPSSRWVGRGRRRGDGSRATATDCCMHSWSVQKNTTIDGDD